MGLIKAFYGILFTFCLFLAGCGDNKLMNNATFSSMDSCISSITQATGGRLDPTIDKSDHITGFIRGGDYDGKQFGCQIKSDSVAGWYSLL